MWTHAGPSEVSGLPAYSAPRAGGKVAAGLVFRVGRVDETLETHGITHLIEHLALDDLGLANYQYNGSVGLNATHFRAYGSRDEVVGFLRKVGATLGGLPLARLDRARDVIETETRPLTVGVLHAAHRFGPHGAGLANYPEFGARRATPEEVTAWASRYFTTHNAAVWFAGMDVPDSLELGLPLGELQPVAEIAEVPRESDSFTGGPGMAGLTVRAPRTTQTRVFSGALERLMWRILRHERGLSYAPQTSYDPLNGSEVMIVASTDMHERNQRAAVDAFVEVTAALRAGDIAAGDVHAGIRALTDMLREPAYDAEALATIAETELLGGTVPSATDLIAGVEATTLDDVAAIASAVMGTALLSVPRSPGRASMSALGSTVPASRGLARILSALQRVRSRRS